MYMHLVFAMQNTEIAHEFLIIGGGEEAELHCVCRLEPQHVGALLTLQSQVYFIRCVLFHKMGVYLVTSSGYPTFIIGSLQLFPLSQFSPQP